MEIETAVSHISGGVIISASFFLIHLVITINKSHKPIRPIIFSSLALLFAISLATWSTGAAITDAVTVVVSISISDIFRILPIMALLVFSAILMNSLGQRKTLKIG